MTPGFTSWVLYKYRVLIAWGFPAFTLFCLSGIYPKYDFEIILLMTVWLIMVPFSIWVKIWLEKERREYLCTKEALCA